LRHLTACCQKVFREGRINNYLLSTLLTTDAPKLLLMGTWGEGLRNSTPEPLMLSSPGAQRYHCPDNGSTKVVNLNGSEIKRRKTLCGSR